MREERDPRRSERSVNGGGGGVAFTDPCAHREKEVWVSASSVCIYSEEERSDRLSLTANVQPCHDRWTVQGEHLNKI